MDPVLSRLDEHSRQDEERFYDISETLKIIKENHLAHLQADSARNTTDIGWLKWGVLAIIGIALANLFKA